MKVPIIVEDSKLIIFFPTSSYRGNNCIWISYNNLLKYSRVVIYGNEEVLSNIKVDGYGI